MGELVGYARVSSIEQNEGRQLEALKEAGVNLEQHLFVDKASGKDTQRPQLEACLKFIRKGDCLVVSSIDRLARNLGDLLKLVEEVTAKGASLKFIREALEFSKGKADPMAELLLHLLGAFAAFERSLIRERQLAGIQLAKQSKKYKGSKPKLTPEQVKELKARAAAGESRTKLAKEFGISRVTLYAYLSPSGATKNAPTA